MSAQILARSILDSVFTVTSICDDPGYNYMKYIKGSYRTLAEHMNANEERYRGNLNYHSIWEIERDILGELAAFFSFTDEERNNLKNIKYWPIPSHLKKASFITDASSNFLCRLYDMEYFWLSELSHQSWGIMPLLYVPNNQEKLDTLINQALFMGTMYMTMLLSEVERTFNILEKPKLVYLWALLGIHYNPAKEYYTMRYEAMLL